MKQSLLLISLCLLWSLTAAWAQEDVLFIYAEQGNAEQVQDVLAAGANVNAVNLQGDTPLLLAIRGNSPEVVRTLIDAGANVAWVNPVTNATAFRLAARNPQREAIYRMLIDVGAYISISGSRLMVPDPAYEAAFNPVPAPAEPVAVAAPAALTDNVNRTALREAGLSVTNVQAVQQEGVPVVIVSLANTSRVPLEQLEVRAVFLRQSSTSLTERIGEGGERITMPGDIPLQPGTATQVSLPLRDSQTGARLEASGNLRIDLYYRVGDTWVNFGQIPFDTSATTAQ